MVSLEWNRRAVNKPIDWKIEHRTKGERPLKKQRLWRRVYENAWPRSAWKEEINRLRYRPTWASSELSRFVYTPINSLQNRTVRRRRRIYNTHWYNNSNPTQTYVICFRNNLFIFIKNPRLWYVTYVFWVYPWWTDNQPRVTPRCSFFYLKGNPLQNDWIRKRVAPEPNTTCANGNNKNSSTIKKQQLC